jgi:hypothetical protein
MRVFKRKFPQPLKDGRPFTYDQLDIDLWRKALRKRFERIIQYDDYSSKADLAHELLEEWLR